jgi:hypothetical protein
MNGLAGFCSGGLAIASGATLVVVWGLSAWKVGFSALAALDRTGSQFFDSRNPGVREPERLPVAVHLPEMMLFPS